MVGFNTHYKTQQGSGIMDSLLQSFSYARYPNEQHAISGAKDTYGQPFNFMGPGTRIDLRLNPDGTPKPTSTPINSADY